MENYEKWLEAVKSKEDANRFVLDNLDKATSNYILNITDANAKLQFDNAALFTNKFIEEEIRGNKEQTNGN